MVEEEAITAAHPSEPLSDEEVGSDDDLICKVEEYDEGGKPEWDAQPQPIERGLPHTSHPIYTRPSTGGDASSSGTGPSTSGAGVPDDSFPYVCRDWVSWMTLGELKSITRQYRLGNVARLPGPNDRSHLPPSG